MALVKIKSQTMITGMKLMHNAGIKACKIAEVHNISSATYQNVRKSGWNLGEYKKLVNGQMRSWKVKRDSATTVKPKEVSNDELNVAFTQYYDVLQGLTDNIVKLTNTINKLFPNNNNN